MALKILPLEWKILTSKRHPDRKYYFNTITGVSCWEFPESIEKPLNKKEESISNSNLPTRKEYHNTIHSSGKQTSIKSVNIEQKSFIHNVSQDSKVSSKLALQASGSNDDMSKPPTAVVAPVVYKSTSDNFNETLDVALLKRKLEDLSRERLKEATRCHKKARKKKKRGKVVDESSSISQCDFSDNSKKRKLSLTQSINSQQTAKVQDRSKTSSVRTSFAHSPVPASRIDIENKTSSSYREKFVFTNENILEDVEMLDVSADLTNIDDLPSFKDGTTDNFASYYLVVDTNVLISELKLIDEIKDTPVEGCGPPHIFIPWIVIQELDRLKNRATQNTSTWKAAAQAVRYLNTVLKAKHPRFHGQSPQEVEDWAKTYSKCNDDRLLECCMSLANKMPREKIILLTNDKNLSNKALICNIRVHSWNSMMKTLKTDVVFNANKSDKSSTTKRKNNSFSSTEEGSKVRSSPGDEANKRRDNCKQEIQNLMSSARQCLKEVLEPFLEAEMYEAYGDPWKAFPIERRLLKGILDAIIKYWSLVFEFNFSEKDKRKFESLREKVNQPEGFYGDKKVCLTILSDIEDIFIQIQRRWKHIKPCTEQLQCIRTSCLEAFNKYNGIESSIQDTELQGILALFEHNWAVLNHLCGVVLDHYQVPHDIQYEKQDAFPDDSAFHRLMCNLYPNVNELQELMSKMMNCVAKSLRSDAIYEKLFKALKEFVPSLQIQTTSPLLPHISAKSLENFCNAPQNRDMIEIGVKQITDFQCKLDKALAVMMSTKRQRHPQSTEDKMMLD